MRTASGDPERLRTYTGGAHETTTTLRSEGLALEAVLEALVRSPSEVGPLPGPELAQGLVALADRMAELDRLPRQVGDALAAVGVPFPVAPQAAPAAPGVRHAAEARLAPLVDAHDGEAWRQWLHEPSTRALLRRLEDQLRPPLWRLGRLTSDQLMAATDLLRSLEGPQLEAVLRGLDPADLARLLADLRRRTLLSSTWDLDARHDFYSDLAPHLSLDTWRYLARFTDDLDPPVGGKTDRADIQALYAVARYAPFEGVLSAHGVRQDGHAFGWRDVRQGYLGTCATMAVLMAIARRRPEHLEEMVTAHPNGLVTVTFPDGHRVTVSTDLPEHPDRPGVPLYAGLNSLRWHVPVADPDRRHTGRWVAGQELRASDVPGTWELWPMVLEKAFAQRAGGWEAIESQTLEDMVTEWTGETAVSFWPDDLDTLRRAVAAGQLVLVGTRPERDMAEDPAAQALLEDRRLAPSHGYVVTGLRDTPDGAVVELANPWDAAHPPRPVPAERLPAVVYHLVAAPVPGTAATRRDTGGRSR